MPPENVVLKPRFGYCYIQGNILAWLTTKSSPFLRTSTIFRHIKYLHHCPFRVNISDYPSCIFKGTFELCYIAVIILARLTTYCLDKLVYLPQKTY
jgi:hypothetical protein